ncbi:LPXTG cell wall anchor domain-containing protein (plasmid) [Levilactobacillus brevis]|uniref:mucin-binding protein n=1 Tax=Levilactobacillus brevis TaxID=1580 RepID=UPI0021658DA7|nr:LPXTG cell wall anchor domain-containing protein [Levilactobacillus brevis]UVW19820.1 LPXTG cell wall anchor domain-containing protein [Levilactobacillus brevis]
METKTHFKMYKDGNNGLSVYYGNGLGLGLTGYLTTVNVHADSNTDLATNDSVSGANSTSVTTGSAVALSTATSAASKSAVSVASQTSANTAVATSTASSESQTSAVKTNASTPTSTEVSSSSASSGQQKIDNSAAASSHSDSVSVASTASSNAEADNHSDTTSEVQAVTSSTPTSTEVSSSSASSGQQKIDNSAAASSHSDSVSVASTASSNAEADNHSDTTSEVQAVTSSTSTEQTELMAAAKNLSVGRATSLDLLSDTDTTPATDITASATLQSDHDLYTEPTSDPTQTNPWTGQPTFMYLNDPNDATAILPYTDEHYIHYPTATGWTGYVYYVTDDAARGSEFGTKGFHQLHLWSAGDPSKGYAIAPFETPGNPAVDTYYHLYPDPQQATIVYLDDTTHKMLHYTNLKGGRTSSISNYDQTNILNAYANLGYEVVSNDFTKGFKYGDGTTKQQFLVHLKHKIATATVTTPGKTGQPFDPTVPNGPKWPNGFEKDSLNKVVTQTVHYVYTDGTKAADDKTDQVTFTRTGTIDEVTGDSLYQAWTATNGDTTFNKKISPVITGYTPDHQSVDEVTGLTETSANVVTTVTYAINKETAKVTYIDDANGQTLETKDLSGNFNTTDSYRTKPTIDGYLGNGYTFVSDNYPTDGVVYSQDGTVQQFYVHLIKKTAPTEPNKPSTPEKPNVPNKPSTPEKPDVPNKPSTPKKPNVPNKPATPEKQNIPNVPTTPEKVDVPSTPDQPSVPVTSIHLTPSVPVATPVQGQPGNPSQPSNATNNGVINTSTNTGSKVNNGAVNSPELPQTGENNSQSQTISFIGILLAMFGSLHGFLGIKKRRND